ncbi:MAG: hypothetical protein ACREMM_07265 [Gemmatimonadales bacterium]
MIRVLMLLAIPVFTWAGLGCFLGIRRFRYPPLAIPGTGYLSWVASFVLFLGVGGPLTLPKLFAALGLTLFGALCILGYAFTYNAKMKALGITPRRILGLQGRP